MGKRGKKNQNSKMEGENFSPVRNFRTGVRNFRIGVRNCSCTLLLLFFCSLFPSDFISAKQGLTRILYAWVHSTSLALIVCKNYKISHKILSVE